MPAAAPTPSDRSWSFLGNHGHVLVCLARDPDVRLRDIAELVGLTERCVHRIVSELEEAGVVTHVRQGRRNRYAIDLTSPLRHPLESETTVGRLLQSLLDPADASRLGLAPTGGVRRRRG